MIDIKTEIYINQLSQNIKSQQEGITWFDGLSDDLQLEVLRKIVYFILQASARGKDVKTAIEDSKLKSTFTSCQLLLKAYLHEPEGNRLLSAQLAKIVNLPSNERHKSFILLISLFRIADKNKRAKGLEPDRYWWHQDLSDEQIVAKILAEYS